MCIEIKTNGEKLQNQVCIESIKRLTNISNCNYIYNIINDLRSSRFKNTIMNLRISNKYLML